MAYYGKVYMLKYNEFWHCVHINVNYCFNYTAILVKSASSGLQINVCNGIFFFLFLNQNIFVCFVALRPKSTAMVIAGRSVHLNTLFSSASLNKQLTSNRAHTFACN